MSEDPIIDPACEGTVVRPAPKPVEFSGNTTGKTAVLALAGIAMSGVSMMGERPRESHTRQHRTKKARAKTRAQKKARRRNRR